MNIRPDWKSISEEIGNDGSHDELNSAWDRECRSWLSAILEHLNGGYRLYETDNFIVLSDESPRYLNVFGAFLERMLQRILARLEGVASDEGYGKHVAMLFADEDQYYDYVSIFYPEDGEFGLSSGVFINEGYGHFAFPSQDISFAEPIAAHELTHACLAHLNIPIWLNEGIAVVMEEVLAGASPYVDRELIAHHRSYWNNSTIQKFWSGESFHFADEGQELSYSLAQILVRNMSKNYDNFKRFCLAASAEDAGKSAALSFIGVSLHDFVEVLLGDGDWNPSDGLNN